MISVTKWITSAAVACAILPLMARGADEPRPVDGGVGSAFASKTYDIPAKGQVAVVLSFEAGREVVVTTSGADDSDIHLGVKGMYFEAKDTSPFPVCLIKFTPARGDSKFTLTVKNRGTAPSKVALKVKVNED